MIKTTYVIFGKLSLATVFYLVTGAVDVNLHKTMTTTQIQV